MPIGACTRLLADIRACNACAPHLPHGVRPVVQMHPEARILVVGQAPGRKVHTSGIPFYDASGDRLRAWMGVDRTAFYDAQQIALVPMGFCFPGTGPAGDLAPRPECAPLWRARVLDQLPHIALTLVIGRYAQLWHMPAATKSRNVTQVVQHWRDHLPAVIPLPHPSPRNNIWVRRNPWFETELLPELRQHVAALLR
nr:uracil-DNA glycosylase family protein [Rhodoferax sp.]